MSDVEPVEHRQRHPELGRWVYPEEPEYDRDWKREAGR